MPSLTCEFNGGLGTEQRFYLASVLRTFVRGSVCCESRHRDCFDCLTWGQTYELVLRLQFWWGRYEMPGLTGGGGGWTGDENG